MSENEISYKIRGAIFEVYNILGPGLLEIVYEEALFYELKNRGLKVERQLKTPILYKDLVLDNAFIIDLLVEDKVIVELKSVAELSTIHYKQLTSYLKLKGVKLGLLVNFNSPNITDDIVRVVNQL